MGERNYHRRRAHYIRTRPHIMLMPALQLKWLTKGAGERVFRVSTSEKVTSVKWSSVYLRWPSCYKTYNTVIYQKKKKKKKKQNKTKQNKTKQNKTKQNKTSH